MAGFEKGVKATRNDVAAQKLDPASVEFQDIAVVR
jgi:hypothetical protein